MKKIKKFLLGNIKTVIAFVLGTLISGGTVYAATVLAANQVSYTKNSQTTVDGALDTLFTRSNTWIDPSYIDFGTLATNTAKTVLASKNGVCIKRNDTVSCFKKNNWSEEQTHIQQVFSDGSCNVYSNGDVGCRASDFFCYVYSSGSVRCRDYSDDSYCYVYLDGSVSCT